MAPTDNSKAAMESIKKNYLKQEDITINIKAHGLEEYVELKNNGEYQFFKCEDCDGPILGHIQAKCKDNYDDRTITKFEGWLKRIPEFRTHIKERTQAIRNQDSETQANILSHAVRQIVAETAPNPTTNPTTQLVISRWPPIWTGQKFDKWRTEIEK